MTKLYTVGDFIIWIITCPLGAVIFSVLGMDLKFSKNDLVPIESIPNGSRSAFWKGRGFNNRAMILSDYLKGEQNVSQSNGA